MWKLNAAYYPVTQVKTSDLDPKKNRLVCCHPHGILCFGVVVCVLHFHFNPNFNQTLRLPLVRIHVDCRPYFQAFFRGSVLFRLVKPVSNSGHTVFPTGNILASSLSRVTSSSWWDGGVALLLWSGLEQARRRRGSRWGAPQRWRWPPSPTKSSFTRARGKDLWRWLWRTGPPWFLASSLARLRFMTKVGCLLNSGPGSRVQLFWHCQVFLSGI